MDVEAGDTDVPADTDAPAAPYVVDKETIGRFAPRFAQFAPKTRLQKNIAIFLALFAFSWLMVLFCSIHTLEPDDQVQISSPSGKKVVNGPGVVVLSPFHKKVWLKASLLGPLNYALVKNNMTGVSRVEAGPQLLFVGAYDELVKIENKVVLKKDEYIRVADQQTGEVRILTGPQMVIPAPTESTVGAQKATILTKSESVRLRDTTTGAMRTVLGPGLVFPGAFEKMDPKRAAIKLARDEWVRIIDNASGLVRVEKGEQMVFINSTEAVVGEDVNKAVSLTEYESVRLRDTATGVMRVVIGAGLVFPGPFEKMDPKREGIRLLKNQWVRIIDNANGRLRVEVGEQVVFLSPTEAVVGEEVNQAVNVNTDSAVLVLNKQTGKQRLVTEQGIFIPGPYEHILDVQARIHVEPHEAVIVRDAKGGLNVRSGSDGNGTGIAFFLPPHCQVVEMQWSSYSADSATPEKVSVKKVDTRAQYVSFNYQVRTADNVKLRLEGSIFWRVKDVPKMIRATSDPRGDVWHHARSSLIQAVSKVELAAFMAGFNGIVMDAFREDAEDGFYLARGVEVQSIELTRFECEDAKTAEVLQAIIQETTNRINRLQAQESENEVRAAKLAADIKLEKATTQLIETQAKNERLRSEVAGEASGLKLAKNVATFLGGSLKTELPNLDSRLELYRLHETLRSKNEDTKSLASGQATLFLTPQDMNLKLQMGETAARKLSTPGM